MSTINHEPTIDTTADEDLDYAAFNGGYEYGDTEFVPDGAPSLADVDPATIDEIDEVAGDLLDKNPNVRKKFMRILATAGGATALSFLLAACGSTTTDAQSPKPHVTHSAEASPSPTPSADTGEIFQTQPIAEAPAVVQQLEALPNTLEGFQQFNAAPKEDQLAWLDWKTGGGIVNYAQQYQIVSKSDLDIYPTDISTTMDVQKALTVAIYNIRSAASMPTAGDAQKALIASLADGMSDGAYQLELNKYRLDPSNTMIYPDAYAPATPQIEALSQDDTVATVTNSTDFQTDAQGRQFKRIDGYATLTADNGTTQTQQTILDLYPYTYKNSEGQDVVTWLAS